MKIILIFLSLTLASCNTKDSNKPSSVKIITQKNDVIKKDTIITYNIDGISSEGTEAKVIYKKQKIYESEINVYGETGQVKLTYKFFSTDIEVTENSYKYKEDLKSINSKDDLILLNSVKYYIDYSGKVLSNNIKEHIDIFKGFKVSVPFELK